ncbi:MAG: winged helix-turn-helix domain-containing protein [Muribaculaceae bacterium]|nr:winged helix-turn-helix domain-containing protein [Muribaculaceae bacterium]
MATKKITLSQEERIGFAAGEIYNYLNENGTTSFSKMKKDLDLKGNFADLGLGWLARENKVEISQKGPAVKVSLR